MVKNVRQVCDIDYYLSLTLALLAPNIILTALASAATAGSVYTCACHRCRPALARYRAVVILAFYLVLVSTSTVFDRESGRAHKHESALFWSYREIMARRTKLIAENF